MPTRPLDGQARAAGLVEDRIGIHLDRIDIAAKPHAGKSILGDLERFARIRFALHLICAIFEIELLRDGAEQDEYFRYVSRNF